MLISKLLWKSYKKIHAQKVIDKNVMEKCTFSTFTHVHQIGFLITFWGSISTLNHFLLTLKLTPHRMAQNLHGTSISALLFSIFSKKFKITALYCWYMGVASFPWDHWSMEGRWLRRYNRSSKHPRNMCWSSWLIRYWEGGGGEACI